MSSGEPWILSSLSSLSRASFLFWTDRASVRGIEENDSAKNADLLVKGRFVILSWLADSLYSYFFSMEL